MATALAAFATELGDDLNRVTVVTLSEFGRRVEENGSGGLDHGHGNAVLVVGGGVDGGRVHGRWPGLAARTWSTATWPAPPTTAPCSPRCWRSAAASLRGTVFPGLGSGRLGLARAR